MGLSQYVATLWQNLWAWVVTTVGGMGIADIFDMLIVSFVIYKLIQFLRKSRLGLIARSMFLFAIIIWVSGWLNLTVIHFALSRTLELGILALVILFRPEIRQSLERLGQGKIGGFFGRSDPDREQNIEKIIDQTVTACLRMAEDREGALIVFERKIGLEDEAKTGTRLDAQISAELLMNLFIDKAPLHDGAVIIRRGRLASAGCMLPLSDNRNLSRDLGMRHRAGIGVSERSDAVAVMISEETGSISVAINGTLRRHLASGTLENLLRNELIQKDAPKKTSVLIKLLGGKKP